VKKAEGKNDWEEITSFGLWPASRVSGGVEGPERTKPDEKQIAICAEWIAGYLIPAKTFNLKRSSYGLHNIVKRWANNYVSNGAFIEAARRAGFEMRRVDDGLADTHFKMKYLEERKGRRE
jgi:hypothetical protein